MSACCVLHLIYQTTLSNIFVLYTAHQILQYYQASGVSEGLVAPQSDCWHQRGRSRYRSCLPDRGDVDSCSFVFLLFGNAFFCILGGLWQSVSVWVMPILMLHRIRPRSMTSRRLSRKARPKRRPKPRQLLLHRMRQRSMAASRLSRKARPKRRPKPRQLLSRRPQPKAKPRPRPMQLLLLVQMVRPRLRPQPKPRPRQLLPRQMFRARQSRPLRHLR